VQLDQLDKRAEQTGKHLDNDSERGHTPGMFDAIYKLWYSLESRKRWEAAARMTHEGKLATWMRDNLDADAKRDLSEASK